MPIAAGQITRMAPALSLMPTGINSSGVVVGTKGTVSFTWTGVLNEWSLPGASLTSAAGIDDAGHVAGTFYQSGNSWSAGFMRSSDGRETRIDRLGPYAPTGAVALHGIASNGIMVGTERVPSGRYAVYLGRPGAFASEGILEFPSGFANVSGVNVRGVIVGTWSTRPGEEAVAFTMVSRRTTTFGAPGAKRTLAYGINDHGDIVGGFSVGTGAGAAWRCFLRSADGQFSEIPTPAGSFCQARAIANNGTVVGIFGDPGSPRGFIFTPGVSAGAARISMAELTGRAPPTCPAPVPAFTEEQKREFAALRLGLTVSTPGSAGWLATQRKVNSLYPAYWEPYFRLGMHLFNQERNAEAAKLLEQGVQVAICSERSPEPDLRPIHGAREALRMALAMAYSRTDRRGDAEALMRAALSAGRDDLLVVQMSCTAYSAMGNLTEGRRACDTALQREPRNADAWAALARLELSTTAGDTLSPGARLAMGKVLELEPDSERAREYARLLESANKTTQ